MHIWETGPKGAALVVTTEVVIDKFASVCSRRLNLVLYIVLVHECTVQTWLRPQEHQSFLLVVYCGATDVFNAE